VLQFVYNFFHSAWFYSLYQLIYHAFLRTRYVLREKCTCARLTCVVSGDRHCRIRKHVTANVTASHRVHDQGLGVLLLSYKSYTAMIHISFSLPFAGSPYTSPSTLSSTTVHMYRLTTETINHPMDNVINIRQR
jgi:hypothetical protein